MSYTEVIVPSAKTTSTTVFIALLCFENNRGISLLCIGYLVKQNGRRLSYKCGQGSWTLFGTVDMLSIPQLFFRACYTYMHLDNGQMSK